MTLHLVVVVCVWTIIHVFKDGGRICSDDCIAWIKPASRNHVSIWNRMFDDNLKMDCYD